ncbi:MAG: sigma-70 family RNA polymerase sigma factor [Gemmataceae bacterium]|nr:sigma-70 family RNA polymerase sigma factor [Gemmataceae bacterium]
MRDRQDAESWREFVALYEPLLLRYVISRGLADADARDVVQEIFITLLRSMPSFRLDRQRGRFRSWLWSITIHAIVDSHRRRQAAGRAESGWRERRIPDPSPVANPDSDWLTAYQRRVLEFVLPQVRGQAQRRAWTCFEQHVLKGRPAIDVGLEVGLSAAAVRVSAARILAKVRQRCAEYME